MMRRFVLLCMLLLPWTAYPQTADVQAETGFVGSATCKTCHPDIWLNFYRNAHFKSVASGKEAPGKTGCEGCHGPGAEHVKKPGKTNIKALSQMTPDQTLNACLGCHSKDLSRANIRRSAHTEADVACSSCHSIHKAATPKNLLAKQQTELCYGCHAIVKASFEMPSKHRVNEGAVQCSDCHNPHGGFAPTWRTGTRPRMMNAAMDQETPCLKCHVDKRGPFVYEHAAVRVEGCEGCHMPHGSMNAKLLKRPVTFTLCLECHTGGGTFGTQGQGVSLQPSSHNLLDPRYQKCTVCHVRLHGSNSDPNFLR